MAETLTNPPRRGDRSFLNFPVCENLDDLQADIALLGITACPTRWAAGPIRSPIRRASEMPHIGEIYRLGIRGAGSAREEELRAAEAYGAHIITAYEIHDNGMADVLRRIPDAGNYYITLDVDGLDPALMPGVLAPVVGGVTFHQVRQLIHGLVGKGREFRLDKLASSTLFPWRRELARVAGESKMIWNFWAETVALGGSQGGANGAVYGFRWGFFGFDIGGAVCWWGRRG